MLHTIANTKEWPKLKAARYVSEKKFYKGKKGAEQSHFVMSFKAQVKKFPRVARIDSWVKNNLPQNSTIVFMRIDKPLKLKMAQNQSYLQKIALNFSKKKLSRNYLCRQNV